MTSTEDLVAVVVVISYKYIALASEVTTTNSEYHANADDNLLGGITFFQ